MKVTEIIKQAQGKTLFSFEVLPPKKGESINDLFGAITPLMEFDPKFIDVTYHREEYIFKPRPDGSMQKITTKKRPGTVGICAAIMNKYHVEAVPHLICGGFSKEETENALIDLDFLGIDNVLALRGDGIKSEPKFIPHPDGNAYATDLVQQITNMNKGIYLDEELENANATDFCISVAAYPEVHMDAVSAQSDLEFLKQKIALGAEYAVTQMFFDNQKYFDFVALCRKEGINIPIIPGLKPLATLGHRTMLPKVFHLDLPEELEKELDKCKDNNQVKEVGVEWCIKQSKELKNAGVPSLHYYTMSKSVLTQQIAKEVF
jgi:methylenetetrahydrofolate reductase (NADPH)